MAEVAGLALSVVPLASIFSACIECMDYFDRGRNCSKSFKNAMDKFDALETRLRKWGNELHVDKPGNALLAPKNQWGQEHATVEKALNSIIDILHDRQTLEKKYGLQEEGLDADQEHNLSCKEVSSSHRNSVSKSRLPNRGRQQVVPIWKKTMWAVRDNKKFDTLISDLAFWISILEKLTDRLQSFEVQHIPIQYANSSLRPVAKYVSRPALEDKIRNQLTTGRDYDSDESRTVVVWGLGGSGKSQLMLNYIKKYRQDYGLVIWMEAGEKETMERDYIRLYRALFPEVARSAGASLKAENAVLAVKGWFHQLEKRSLLVIDSADCIDNEGDPSYINLNYFLPDAPRMDIVITTRSSQAQALSSSEAVRVGELTENEAIQLFRRYVKPCINDTRAKQEIPMEDKQANQEVSRIVDELGYLALAITIAGSYISVTPRLASDISLYLPEYHEQRKRLLSRKAIANIHSYKESVLGTWEASFEAIKRQSSVAANLLNLLAFLNFDDIFLDLFKVDPDCKETFGSKDLPSDTNNSSYEEASDFGDMAESEEIMETEKIPDFPNEKNTYGWETLVSPETILDQYTIQAGFEMLQSYSLISWRDDLGAYTMHKLVHTWGCDRLEVKERQRWSLAAIQLLSTIFRACYDSITPLKLRRFVPHVKASFTMFIGNFDTAHAFKDEILQHMADLADLLCRAGELDFAVLITERINQFAEEKLGTDNTLTIQFKIDFAGMLMDQGKCTQAEATNRQILRIQEKIVHANHFDILATKSRLAVTLLCQDRAEEARELAIQDLEAKKRFFGEEHIEILRSKLILSMVYLCMKQHEVAEKFILQAIEVGRKFNMVNIYLEYCKCNMGRILKWNGRFKDAEELVRRVLGELEKSFKEDNPLTLHLKEILAWIMDMLGQPEAAEILYTYILEGRKREIGAKHPYTLETMYSLALLLFEGEKHQEAVELAKECLRLRKEVLGILHKDTIMIAEVLKFWHLSLQRNDYDSKKKSRVSHVKILSRQLRQWSFGGGKRVLEDLTKTD